MHAPTPTTFRTVNLCRAYSKCRFLAGRRFPLPRRIHSRGYLHRDDKPSETPEPAWGPFSNASAPPFAVYTTYYNQEEAPGSPGEGPEKPDKPVDKNNYGSAARRAGRNIKKQKDLPPVHIPQRFLDNHVTLRETLQSAIASGQKTAILNDSEDASEAKVSEDAYSSTGANSTDKLSIDSRVEEQDPPIGQINMSVMEEIQSIVTAGLSPSTSQFGDSRISAKPHLVLHCPRDGGMFFLDALTKHLATTNNTDLIEIDAQDIAEIGGDYLDESATPQSEILSSLGYDVYTNSIREQQNTEDPLNEDEDAEQDEEDDSSRQPKAMTIYPGNLSLIPMGGTVVRSLTDLLQGKFQASNSPQHQAGPSKFMGMHAKDATGDLKLSLFIDTILHACDAKRASELAENDGPNNHVPATSPSEDLTSDSKIPADNVSLSASSPNGSALIIQIKDYPEIQNTPNGGRVIDALHDSVQQRRKGGQKVLVLGTSCSPHLGPSWSRPGFKSYQSQADNGPTRTVLVPVTETSKDEPLKRHHKDRIMAINIRHLQDMIRRLASNPVHVKSLISQAELSINSAQAFTSEMSDQVWSSDQVHRIATIALGFLEAEEDMQVKHIEQALQTIEVSDNVKYDWMANEKEKETKSYEKARRKPPKSDYSKLEAEKRLNTLKKQCNTHEKKLLNGVIDPASIRTTFADIQVPKEIVETLKTLTSLSLVRPDAFTYGVLATDKIPGLLLYGPPGTGKTLLAKAVAKESGATVLEVSGSDVYDMYVGEGEKNVKAIFSLAKKLTPCIVFIDEADAILGSRGGSANRTSHRELINQFLREWDGMNELSAFIMVATNRPFDLDEASLRRLPRRMLVDLPSEKDREEILKIHLKDETLDPEVSLSRLAADTPFYSGSDLKNLSVAAALACVREEFDTAAAAADASLPSTDSSASSRSNPPSSTQSPSSSDSVPSLTPETAPPSTPTSPSTYTYPARRTLLPRHFARAMEEISASISEDMGSLTAIRKFDEKYGDRRGRRKKLGGGYGFGTLAEAEREKLGQQGAMIRRPK